MKERNGVKRAVEKGEKPTVRKSHHVNIIAGGYSGVSTKRKNRPVG
jgi:hypothetical protein